MKLMPVYALIGIENLYILIAYYFFREVEALP